MNRFSSLLRMFPGRDTMKRLITTALLLAFLPCGILYALDFSGNYGANEDGEIITLSLEQDAVQ
jgi:hypothetical protein